MNATDLSSRSLDGVGAAIAYAPTRCLYDHLQRLQELIGERRGGIVRVLGLETADLELGHAGELH